ncbi:hypothetical protein X975_26583, partial [Stegodyphus mimosarum]
VPKLLILVIDLIINNVSHSFIQTPNKNTSRTSRFNCHH